VYAVGSSCVFEYISVAFALLPSFWCASCPVIPAFVLRLLCFSPNPVLGFPTGLYTVGFEGRINYTAVASAVVSGREEFPDSPVGPPAGLRATNVEVAADISDE